jgi:hypothetical protein
MSLQWFKPQKKSNQNPKKNQTIQNNYNHHTVLSKKHPLVNFMRVKLLLFFVKQQLSNKYGCFYKF